MSLINYVYNPLHSALFAALAPVLWCLSLSWAIFSSELGHKSEFLDSPNCLGSLDFFMIFLDFITSVLEWRGFMIATRLSYAIYLTQYSIFYFNIGSTRTAEHFGLFKTTVIYSNWIKNSRLIPKFQFQLHLPEYFFIILASIVLTLFVELPFCNIKKLLLDQRPVSKPKPTTEYNNNVSDYLNNNCNNNKKVD